MDDAQLLEALPADARNAVLALRASPLAPERHSHACNALKAVQWPAHTTPLPPSTSSMTASQQALARLLLPHQQLQTQAFSYPYDLWRRRRWLGLDPAGPWEDLVDGAPRGQKLATTPLPTLLAQLRPRQRFQALVEVSANAWGFNAFFVDVTCGNPDSFKALIADGDDGAADAADFAIALVDGADWFPSRGELPLVTRAALLLAMARGSGIDARHDRLLPLATSWTLEILRALPAPRRAPALLAATRGRALPYVVEAVLLECLPDVPDKAVVAALDAVVGQSGPAETSIAALKKLQKQAALAPLLAPIIERLAQQKTKKKTTKKKPAKKPASKKKTTAKKKTR